MNSSSQILVFDRALVRKHRDRAAAGFADVLVNEAAGHLMERLGDVKRDFQSVLICGAGGLAGHFSNEKSRLVVAADVSEQMLRRGQSQESNSEHGTGGGPPTLTLSSRGREQTAPASNDLPIVGDEEFLPFAPNSFDLIVANLNLHWVNDLPGALVQMRQALKPDGLFHAAILGGSTLHELRSCMLEAEMAVSGGASPRLSPSIDLLTATSLMQRAGFASPITDNEKLTLTYPDLFALMHDLRNMGETNAHLHRLRHSTGRRLFSEAEQLYRERFLAPDGGLAASFELLFMHGWKEARG